MFSHLTLMLLEGGEASPKGGILDMAPALVIVFGIFYFLLIRPEKKKQKARETMLGGMKKGDKVMMTSGLLGSIAQVKEDMVTLQVADGVRMRFTRAAVQEILTDKKEESEDKAEEPAKAS